MRASEAQIIYAKDYKAPNFRVTSIKLYVSLYEDKARVKATTHFHRHPDSTNVKAPLVLDGVDLKLISVSLNGQALREDQYTLSKTSLMLPEVPDEFELTTESECAPQQNKTLEGLYQSGKIFCTQCESEGFRKITYFLDRPDVMAKYTTTIEADQANYPVLLSNGNPIDSGTLEGGRHYVTYEDPFPKPSYLFALVAGDLVSIEDDFKTMSGRTVHLTICVEKGNEAKCTHAMNSLKKAMKWDEVVFGLECDLESYKVVAVNDFNFGAMENKGLNIFNSLYVLADPKTATDGNYQAIEGVIGHEYFHNWTGNRVTCRDWFQITLKEGLTVFRDQEFSSDMGDRQVCRIGDVRVLRDHQFVEDAGPNAHPIRPDAYMEINNFYTVTVYNKGAEVIRMIHTLIGKESFCEGITKYFELYDGQAVTTDDFVHAMEVASKKDLKQFRRWYSQAGTPECQVRMDYDEKNKTVSLHVEQRKPTRFASEPYEPFHFPLCIGLLDESGADLPLAQKGKRVSKVTVSETLEITDWKQTFTFHDIPSKPIPSLLRNFSAPIKLDYNYSNEELIFLFLHDSDHFNRYEAGQRLATRTIQSSISAAMMGQNTTIEPSVIEAFGAILTDANMNSALKAECLILPSLASLIEGMTICNFEIAFKAREELLRAIAVEHEPKLIQLYRELHQVGGYETSKEAIGRRGFKNRILSYLLLLEKSEYLNLAKRQFEHADNMTDESAALSLLCQTHSDERDQVIKDFYEKWKNDTLVMDKWLVAQASSKRSDTLDRVQTLESDPVFELKNPNKIRSLLGVFSQNLIRFHDQSGKAYQHLASKILEIDEFNPSAASHLAAAYKKFGKLEGAHKQQMEKALKQILAKKDLSKHTYEIVSKTLKSAKISTSPAQA